MYIIGVKFKNGGPISDYISEKSYAKDEKVIVETEKGKQLGIVCTVKKSLSDKKLSDKIIAATEEDYHKYLKNIKDAKSALLDTKLLIKKYRLKMNLIDASYTFDRKILLFNFISEERVDFRELVKELAAKYRTRIELRQLGVRDKAKELGGIGLCGRILCCHACLREVKPVNINMVKTQGIALNPTKINGACGRLLCCFTYENSFYEENRSYLPKIGDKVIYKGLEGTVTELNIIEKKYKIKMDNNTFEEISIDESN